MKAFLPIFLVTFFAFEKSYAQCVNSDFEQGNFSNWQGGSGTPNGGSGNVPGGCCPIALDQLFGPAGLIVPRFTITSGPGTDPNTLNNVPVVAPGGNFSARLGEIQNSFYAQNNPGPLPAANAEMLSYTFTVSAATPLFVYQYAVVLEDPDTFLNPHSPAEKPRFEISVFDINGNIVPDANCGHYEVTADSNITGFETGVQTSSSVIHYRNWTTVGIDLSLYIGQVITIQFQVGDCALGGHFAYAYIDAYCAPSGVITEYCVGQNSVILTAPPGFAYLWMPGGETTQTITINNPVFGSTYTCQLTSVTGCVAIISTDVQPTIINANFGYVTSCLNPPVSFFDSTIIQNGSVGNYTWDFGDGSPIISGVQNPVHTFTSTGTFNVQMIATTTAGCSDTVIIPITILDFAITSAGSTTVCSSSPATLTASGGISYTWSPSTSLNTTTGATVIATPTITTTYTVIGTSINGCIAQSTEVINVFPTSPINIIASDDSICVGESSTITASGAATYLWSPSTGLSATTGNSVSATPISSITYTVTSTDANGCSGITTVPIIVLPTPIISVSTDTICIGEIATVTVSGASTYLWSDGSTGNSISVNPIASTSYNVIGSTQTCTDTTTAFVVVNPLPNIIISPTPLVVCTGSSALLTTTGADTYSWSPATYLNATTGNSITASPTADITYTIVGTDVNGCTNQSNAVLNISTAPPITIIANDDSICLGESLTLTAFGATTYLWSPATFLNSTTGNSISAAPTTDITYTVIASDANGCSGTGSIPIYVLQLPVISVTTDTICIEETATISVTGASTYLWSSGSTGNSISVNPVANTTYTVIGIQQTCSDTSSATVIVNPLPTIIITPTVISICTGSSAQLTASGADTYSWSPATDLSSTTGSLITVTPTGNITYTVVGVDVNGCSDQSTVSINILPVPPINIIASNDSICLGQSTSLTASGAATYTWSPSTGLSSTTGNNISAVPTADITYTIIGLDANGCSGTGSIPVHVLPIPNIVVTTDSICIGETATINVSGASTYLWSDGSTGNNITVSPIANTTYTVIGSIQTCSDTSSTTVIVNPLPTIITTPTTISICTGSTAQLLASGADIYTWSPSTFLSSTTGSLITSTPSGNITYTVIGVDVNGCSGQSTVAVNISSSPPINIIASEDSICLGESLTLIANGATTYAWSPSTYLSSTTGNNISATPTTNITYSVIASDASGCSGTGSIPIYVLPVPNTSVSTDTICSGETATISVSGASTYLWSNGSTGNSISVNPVISTTYTVVGSIQTCSDTSSSVVQVNQLPILITAPSVVSICTGSSAQLTASGADIYSWSPATYLSATTGNLITSSPTTNITYTVVGVDANGCSDQSTVAINISSSPPINIIASDDSICLGESLTLIVNGATTYTWSPSTYLSSTTGNNISATPTTDITYSVTASDASGCTGTGSIPIYVLPNPNISVTTDTICIGETATLNVSGASTYSWSNGSTGNNITVNPSVSTTYSVIGTQQTCADTSSSVVIVNLLPIIITAPTFIAVCTGSSAQLSASGANTYSWSPATGLNTTTGNIVTTTPTGNITYTVTGTDINSCVNTETVAVTLGPTVVIVPVIADTTICNGASVSLSVSGANSYTWSPTTSLSSSTGSTVTASPSINTTYTVTGTDISGCLATTNITIHIGPDLPITATASSDSICNLSSTILTATGADNYTWSPAVDLSSSTGNVVTANPLATSIYTIVGTNNSGCIGTTTIVITINPPPVISISNTNPIICPGGSATLNASGAATYSWSPSVGLNITTGSSVISNPAMTSTYTITGKDNNGCTSNTTAIITIQTPPTIIASVLDTNLCNGASATLNVSGAVTYQWSPSTGLNTTTGNIVNASPNINTTYQVVGYDALGCSGDTTIPVQIDSLPVIIITPNNPPICPGDSVTITANGATTYLWSTNSTGISILANPAVSTSYSVVGTDNNGCTASGNSLVTVNLPPVINASSSFPAICYGSSTLMIVTGATTYTWFPSSGLNTTTGNVVTANPLTSSTYTIIGTDVNGCLDTTSINILINQLPPAAAGPDIDICKNGKAQLNASGGIIYSWSPSTWLSNTDISNPMSAPVYSIFYIVNVTDTNGCMAMDTVNVIVHELPIVDAGPSQIICFPNAAMLNGSGGITYSWSPGIYLNDSTLQSPVCSTPVNMIYTLLVADSMGCKATDTVYVKVIFPFEIEASTDVMICLNEDIQLSATGGNNYEWSPADGLDNPFVANPIASPTATTTYNVFSTDGICFTAEDSVVVIVNQLPEIFAGADAQFLYGETFQLNASTNADNISWTPADLLSCTDCINPVVNHLTQPTTFILTVNDSMGCRAEDSVRINLLCKEDLIYIPNTFTPNGDHKNDVFRIRTYGLSKVSVFRVFSRWGELVFETHDVNEGWDGTYKGQPCFPAVYDYYIEGTCADGNVLVKQGNVTLLR